MHSIVYTLVYLFVTYWNALPDAIHYALGGSLDLVLAFVEWLGYIVYEDFSIGW